MFETLPGDLGFDSQPAWWPIPLLALSGLLVALTIRNLPGTAGHKPAEGFKASGPVPPIELPGIIFASFATLSLGVVLGPEAPLIAIGSGLGVLAVHLLKRDAPEMASVVIGAAGSFAAISTLLGSPLPAAFLMMEVAGIGGAMLGVVLTPGLLAAGVGTLIFIGLDNWTGLGTFSLAVPNIPAGRQPGRVRVPVGDRDRRHRGGHRRRHQAPGAAAPADRRTPHGVPDTRCRRRDRCRRARLRRGDREKLVRGALLGTESAPGPDRRRRRLDRGGTPDARPLQGPCIQLLAEQLPRRPDLPEHVHRRCRRHRALSPSRPADDRGCRDGDRGDDGRDAGTSADVRSHRQRVPRGGRHNADPGRDRRGRGVLRRLSLAHARSRPRGPLDSFTGFDIGYEAIREQTLSRARRSSGSCPRTRSYPPVNPSGDAHGADGKTFPMLDVTRPCR